MNARLALLFCSRCAALTLSMIVPVTTGTAAVTEYLRTTEQLDLSQVTLVVVAPTELKEALLHFRVRHDY